MPDEVVETEEPKDITVGALLEAAQAEDEPEEEEVEETPATSAVEAEDEPEEETEEPAEEEPYKRPVNAEYEYPDLDTELGHQATKRAYLIKSIMDDVKRDEPDLPPAVLAQFESELIDGIDTPSGKRRPFTLEELDHMRKSNQVVIQASGIVRQMERKGQIKKKIAPPVEKAAPRNKVADPAPKGLTASGQKLAARMASAAGLSEEVFNK